MKKVMGFGVLAGILAGGIWAVIAPNVDRDSYGAWGMIIGLLLSGMACVIVSQQIAKLPSLITGLIAGVTYIGSFWTTSALVILVISGLDDVPGTSGMAIITGLGTIMGYLVWDIAIVPMKVSRRIN